MGEPRRRKRIAKGIYRDTYGLSATVKVGTGAEAQQREKRFAFDTPLKDIRAWQGAIRSGAARGAVAAGVHQSRHAGGRREDVSRTGQTSRVIQVAGVRGRRLDGAVRPAASGAD